MARPSLLLLVGSEGCGGPCNIDNGIGDGCKSKIVMGELILLTCLFG